LGAGDEADERVLDMFKIKGNAILNSEKVLYIILIYNEEEQIDVPTE